VICLNFFPQLPAKNDILLPQSAGLAVFMRWAGADYHLGNVCMQSTLRVGIFRTQVSDNKKI
jgi:hypothetical protein